MAKTLNEAALTTRNARVKLAPGLHWRGIDQEVHLGYRKGKRGGVWLVRWRNGAGYRQERLGTADDEMAEGTLSFADAQKAGRDRVIAARQQARATAEGPVNTVRTAILAYMAERDARESGRKGRPVRSDATHRLERYVIGRDVRGRRKAADVSPLAERPLHELSEADLRTWAAAQPAALKGTSRQRLVNDLKAALNAASATHRQKLPATLSATIRHGLSVSAPSGDAEPVARDNMILADKTVTAIIAAARKVDADKSLDGDFSRLITAMAATGLRFSQIARLRVRDVLRETNHLMVPVSRKGKGGKLGAAKFPVEPHVIEALLPAVVGRQPDDVLLMRWRYEQAPGSIRWVRTERGPWTAPAEIVRAWAAIRAEVDLDKSVVPYALRHSSIVRFIRAGLPLRLVAALHDTSVPMIERHYGRWITDGLEELAARAVVSLVPKGV